MKQVLGQYTFFRVIHRFLTTLKQQYGMSLSWMKGTFDLVKFLKEYKVYLNHNENSNFRVAARYLYPCLTDRTALTPIEPTYFFQDTWAASKIFHLKPKHHYDVGSSVKTLGILAQFVPITMIDIRPIDLELENLLFKSGSVLDLPFEDDCIESLSSLCVVEHIGLGRYGDPVDPWGSEKAIEELKRVLKPGGNLLLSVPVDQESRVYFNAHRTFTREHVLQLFKNMELIEEKYVYGRSMQDNYNESKGFGTGLYHFRK